MAVLLGKRVWLENPSNLNIFYPQYQIVKEIPLAMDSGFILLGGRISPFDRYGKAIWVTKNPEYNLENPKTIKFVLDDFRTVPAKYDFVWTMDIEDIWKFVREFMFLGTSISFSVDVQASIYELFKMLGSSNREIYQAYISLDYPDQVVLSSLLTMLAKVQQKEEFVGVVSKYYMRDMVKLARSLKSIKKKFIRFLMSEQEKTDVLDLLFSLKR